MKANLVILKEMEKCGVTDWRSYMEN
jgi:hypothetical protein